MTHVRGHHDKKADYSSLPLMVLLNSDANHLAGEFHWQLHFTRLMAQLNIDANHLGGEFHWKWGDYPRQKAPISPNAGVQCHSLEGTITANWQSLMQIKYLQPRKWNNTFMKRKTGLMTSWNRFHGPLSKELWEPKSNSRHISWSCVMIIYRFTSQHPPWCPMCAHMRLIPITRDCLLQFNSIEATAWHEEFWQISKTSAKNSSLIQHFPICYILDFVSGFMAKKHHWTTTNTHWSCSMS